MPKPSHRGRPPRSRRIAKRVVIVIGVLALVITGFLFVLIKQLEGNITGVDLDTGPTPDKYVDEALNVLVMGDDTRKGQGPSIGGSTPGLSDTTILLHLSADRKFAYGVSLPRDAMVQRPACKTGDGSVDPGGLTQFNAAYAIGGPACTIKTVQQLTGIRVDHFAVIKFRGFKKMVDAIGGVKVCVPQAIDDDYMNSNIHFPKGTYTIDGEQALNYVRERHGVGDGSDLGRMKRQQAFLSSMINKVVSAGTLANPVRLIKFLEAATSSLITDKAFSHLGALAGLGRSLQHIGLSKVKFISVPYEADPADSNRVLWAPAAKQLWNRILHDLPLSKTDSKSALNAKDVAGKKHKSTAEQKADAARVGLCA